MIAIDNKLDRNPLTNLMKIDVLIISFSFSGSLTRSLTTILSNPNPAIGRNNIMKDNTKFNIPNCSGPSNRAA